MTTADASTRVSVLPPPARWGLTPEERADCLSISPNTFDRTVADGIVPKPARVYGRKVWDVWRIDSAFDALRGLPASPQAAHGD